MSPFTLIELLRNHTVFIQTHNFPDPDAIASAFGLQEFLHFYGVEATPCYDGRIDRLSSKKMLDTFGITMNSSDQLDHMTKEDYIVLVDSQKLNSNITDFVGTEVACIDHHPIFAHYAYDYFDLRMTGSCASIIASYFKETKTPISTHAASALAYGIKMDTADFTRGTTSLDIEMFQYLYEHSDWELVKSMYSNTLEYDDLQAYGAAIQNIQLYGTTGFAYIPFNCTPALIAIISDFLLALDVVDIAIIYASNIDGIRFSVRCERKDIHAGMLIARALDGIGNGGGHPAMAGGMIPAENAAVFGDGDGLQTAIHERFLAAEDAMKEEAKLKSGSSDN